MIPTSVFVCFGLLVLLTLAAMLFSLLYGLLFRRPLARWNGEQRVPGLSADAEILRDEFGVPYVYARNENDLWRAQGYLHAQDRLWQMEMARRLAQGRLAEILGEPAVEVDRFTRVIGFRRAMETSMETLDQATRLVLDAYASGVNAFLETHAGRLPAEFTLLKHRPEPWAAQDCFSGQVLIAWALSGNWECELIRAELLEHLGPIRAAELEPDYPADSPTTCTPRSNDAQNLRNTAGLLLSHYERLQAWLGLEGPGVGSNAWVIGPKRSASGRPLLANDPHLTIQIPCLFYENHLEVANDEEDRLRVRGVSIPGAPGVIIGHNARIAWGFTNANVDVQDLFLEELHPQEPDLVRRGDGWEKVRTWREVIHVKGAEAQEINVRATSHGPLIHDLVPGVKAPLALRWAGHDGVGCPGRAVLALNRASDWESFRAALQDWTVPAQNVVYADIDGNIGYQLAGHVPLRQQNLGLVPAPGWDADYRWGGWIPFDDLPYEYNPERGYIVTSNNRIVGDNFEHFLGIDWSPGWRARRIEDLLKAKPRHTASDFQRYQQDVYSTYAERLAPYFAVLDPKNARQETAIKLLQEWNHRLSPESQGAAVYMQCQQHLLDLVFGDKLGPAFTSYIGISRSPLAGLSMYAGNAATRLLDILEQEHSFWYMDAETGQERSREEVLYEALNQAIASLQQDVNEDSKRWQWGRLHQIAFNHALGGLRLVGFFFNRGPYPLGGNADTVFSTPMIPRQPLGMVVVAPTYRQVLEAGRWNQGASILNTGQSGQVGHNHYFDQNEMWRLGEYHPTLWERDAVEEAARYRLTLTA